MICDENFYLARIRGKFVTESIKQCSRKHLAVRQQYYKVQKMTVHPGSFAARLAKRDTFRLAVLRWTMPLDAPRISSGSAALSAASAVFLSPAANASSTFRVKVRIRFLRAWLVAVRFTFCRTRFLAESILGMCLSSNGEGRRS